MTRRLLRSWLILVLLATGHALASAAPSAPACHTAPNDRCVDRGCSQVGRCVTDLETRRCVCRLTVDPSAFTPLPPL